MKIGEGTFKGQLGFNLFYRSWVAEADPRSVLVIAHGVAEHIGRYSRLAEYFANRGLAVYGFDYRGHGKSEGQRGCVEKFSYYADDLRAFLDIVGHLHPGKKIFLFGHSMGGEVVLVQALGSPGGLSGLILSAPAIKIKPELPPALIAIMLPLGLSLPRLGLKKLDSSGLSRDKSVVEKYDNDPLVYRGKISAYLGIGIAWGGYRLLAKVDQIKLPVLILHGEDDRVISPGGSRKLHALIGSKDKSLKFYPGLYHEIHNESEYLQEFHDIEAWINDRI